MPFQLIPALQVLSPLDFKFYHYNQQVIFILFIANYHILFFSQVIYFHYAFLVDHKLIEVFFFIFLSFLVLLIVDGNVDYLRDMCQDLFDNFRQLILVCSFYVSNLQLIIIITILIRQLLLFNLIKLLIIHLSKLTKLLCRLLFLNLLVLAYLLFLITFVLFLFDHCVTFLFYFYIDLFLLLFLVTGVLGLVNSLDLKYYWPLISIVYVLLLKFNMLSQYLQFLIQLLVILFNQNLFLIIYQYFHFYCLFFFFIHSFYRSFN